MLHIFNNENITILLQFKKIFIIEKNKKILSMYN